MIGDEKEKLYSEADIFLLPTYYLGEGQPISIIEALSYGLPVISTNFRGIPEQIKNNENGILLERSDGKSIATAIETIISDISIYEKMSVNS